MMTWVELSLDLPWATAIAVMFNMKAARMAPLQLILYQPLLLMGKRDIYNCQINRLLDGCTANTRCTYTYIY